MANNIPSSIKEIATTIGFYDLGEVLRYSNGDIIQAYATLSAALASAGWVVELDDAPEDGCRYIVWRGPTGGQVVVHHIIVEGVTKPGTAYSPCLEVAVPE